MTRFKLREIYFSYGDLAVLDALSAEFEEGAITALLGPSGCGKTTLLNILAGIRKVEGGQIEGFPEARISYCFQEPRLLPWRTARENLLYALTGLDRHEGDFSRADRYLELSGLKEFADYYPRQFSGGMRRRLALARAFAYPSEVLLLDEAFTSVDLRLRIELMDTFLSLWREETRTTIFVTHEIRDALYLSDKVLLMSRRPSKIVDSIEVIRDSDRKERSYVDPSMGQLEDRLLESILRV